MPSSRVILYEYPLHERVRFLLRLEYLFDRLFEFIESPSATAQHVGITILFEIMDICERADMRSAFLQDIERQKKSFSDIPDLPHLEARLNDLSEVSKALSQSGRIGRVVRNNTWLSNLKNRFISLGWTSAIEMPEYRVWQERTPEQRCAQLREWAHPFLPLRNAVLLLLYNLRQSVRQISVKEGSPNYESPLYGQTYQLVRVWVYDNPNVYPEVVANKHVLAINFRYLDDQQGCHPVENPVSFTLGLCNL